MAKCCETAEGKTDPYMTPRTAMSWISNVARILFFSPIVQQLTSEGNMRRRSLKADPIGDMQMTRWMHDRTRVTYCAKIFTFVGGIRFL